MALPPIKGPLGVRAGHALIDSKVLKPANPIDAGAPKPWGPLRTLAAKTGMPTLLPEIEARAAAIVKSGYFGLAHLVFGDVKASVTALSTEAKSFAPAEFAALEGVMRKTEASLLSHLEKAAFPTTDQEDLHQVARDLIDLHKASAQLALQPESTISPPGTQLFARLRMKGN